MKKWFLILTASLLVVAVVVCVCLSTTRFEYVREKHSEASSDVTSTVSLETGSQSEPMIESVLGNYTEFLIEEYYDSRYDCFLAIKDIDDNGVDDLMLKNRYVSYIDVYSYKDGGVLRVGRINKMESAGIIYHCESYPGVCYVVPNNNICYYTTIVDGLLVEKQIWYSTVDVSEDANLVAETRYAYNNNKSVRFEVLSSFDEINQQSDDAWYHNISKKVNTWTLPVVSGQYNFYYIAEDGMYYIHQSDIKPTKIVDGEVRGLSYDGATLYYCTPTSVIEHTSANDKRLNVVWDVSMMPKGSKIDLPEGILDFKFHGRYLYIKNSTDSAFRVNLDTKEVEMFLEDFSEAVFDDEYCYYIDQISKTFSLYSIDLDILEHRIIAGEGSYKPQKKIISKVFVLNDTVYYYDRVTEKIYSINGRTSIEGYPEDISSQDDSLIHFVAQTDEKTQVLYSFDGNTYKLVANISDYEHIRSNYIVTKRGLFIIPYNDEKISVLWY